MARNNTTICFAALALVVVLAASQLVQAQDCSADVSDLAAKCGQFVQIPGPPTDPSPACCDVVKRVDIPCVCKQVTPPIEKIISMEKVVYIAGKCGRPQSPGTKCGSYTVPGRPGGA